MKKTFATLVALAFAMTSVAFAAEQTVTHVGSASKTVVVKKSKKKKKHGKKAKEAPKAEAAPAEGAAPAAGAEAAPAAH
jgi:hypothetical protein